jgi:hypothetical protein
MLVVRGDKMQFKFVHLAAVALALSACESVQETITPAGPASTSATGQYSQLRAAYDKASGFQSAAIAQTSTNADEASAQKSYATLAQVGLGLVRANCSDFFTKRGDRQQQINLARDVVAIGGTAATAIVGLTGGSALALSIIALSGATLYSGMDTYTKNFLFGAENIESVRTLTMKSIDEHAGKVLGTPGAWSFDSAVGGIMDNQELCKPASIAAAVRLAIRAGTVEAVGENQGATSQQDATIRALIGSTVGYAGVPDDVLLATICWAARPSLNSKEEALVKGVLVNPPFFNGPTTANWDRLKGVVATQCMRLSSTTRTLIDQKIVELKAQANGVAKTYSESGGTQSAPVNSRHYTIMVR